MQKRYKTRSGEVIEGASPEEIIKQMKASGRFTAGEGLDEYMAGVAAREKEYSGLVIETSSAEAFVSSAVRTGLLTPTTKIVRLS